MRHHSKKPKLSRNIGHRTALLKNLATSILKKGAAEAENERYVVTTVQKAKAVRALVERLVTYGKKGDLSARRQAAKFIKEPAVLQELFDVIAPRYASRQGGYTRVLKLAQTRAGDNAEMAVISLVGEKTRAELKAEA
jgi:large subunit ribosomal protein L17